MPGDGDSCIPHTPWQIPLSIFCRDVMTSSCHPFAWVKQTECKGHKSLKDFWAGEEHRDPAGTKELFPSIPSVQMSTLPCLSQLSGAITNLWHSRQPRGALTEQPQFHWKNKEKQEGRLGKAQFGKQGGSTDPADIRGKGGGQPAQRPGLYFRYLSAHKNIKYIKL